MLIEEQRLDTRASGSDQGGKFIESRFERIEADLAKGRFPRLGRKDSHLAETANVGVAKFAAIVEREKHVRMRGFGRLRRADDDLPGHAQMNEQREIVRASI